MQNTFLSPSWFVGYDILFEALFAIVTFFVCYHAFKLYSLTNGRKLKLFGSAFALIASAFVIQSFINALFFFYLRNVLFSAREAFIALSIYSVAIHAYMYLYILGLIVLVYTTFNIEKKRIVLLLAILALIVQIFSVQKLLLFYLISATLGIFIAYHYLSNYKKHHTGQAGLVFIGFIILLMSDFLFIFSNTMNIFYVIGHFVKFVAYIFILANLMLVLHNAPKKK
jgi:hypothetical protein